MTSTFANDSTLFANQTAPAEQNDVEKIDAREKSEQISLAAKSEKTGSTCCGFCDSKTS